MTFDFLVETYATERVKVVSAWSEFTDADLKRRPRSDDPRGRSVQEQMVHQCVSDNLWSRSRAWILTRRIAHTSHHRGQLIAMLRMLGHRVHSNYGPTADTGGLMQHHAPTIYAYPSLKALLDGEARGGAKAVLPGPSGRPVTERPDPAVILQDVSQRNADLTSKSHQPPTSRYS